MKKNIIIGCIISAFFMFLAVRGINFSEVIRSFRSANYMYAVPILLIVLLVLFFRSYRWGIILEPRIKYPQWPLFIITAIGFMTISILPARLGEFTRPFLVKQKSGIRISSTMATIVVERVFDLLTLMVVLGMVILTIPLPPEIFKAGLIILIIVLAIFVLLLLLVGKKELSLKILNVIFDKLPGKVGGFIKNQLHAFIEGLEILPDVKKTLYVAFLSAIIWGLLALSCYLMFFAFGFKLSLINAFALTVIIAIGVMLPAAPGFVGNYHYACVLGLKFFGVNEAAALSYAIALHFLQLIPVIGIGLGLLPSQNISLPAFIKKETTEIVQDELK
jgi:glycosyltransferase 2 family protein